jgi:hypothetical protein
VVQDVLVIVLGIVGITVLMVAGYVLYLVIVMRSRRPVEEGFHYVWIDDDGSAREVTEAERRRLLAEYPPKDSRRPYVKLRYESKDSHGRRRGFLRRRQLPAGVPIAAAEGGSAAKAEPAVDAGLSAEAAPSDQAALPDQAAPPDQATTADSAASKPQVD